MRNRVYGVLGISSIMANWNADFTGYPKSISTGEVFGSDKAFKYPMKKLWENNGEKVLYIKSMKLSDKNKKGEVLLVPKSLKERYEQLFDTEDLKAVKDTKEVLGNLFKAIDVKNFGATFAEAGKNFSITGAVQIGQGFNKYEDTTAEEQQILSPFRDGSSDDKKDEEAKNSTLGSKIVSNEAHYFYPFSINPFAYKEFVELGITDGYTEEDYKKFKKTALVSATAFSTNSKEGCENEFALFIEGENDLYLPNLSEYIQFTKNKNKNLIEINCYELINSLTSKIKNVEVYYNPYTTELKCNIKGAKLFNIFNFKEV
ncbi:MAG: type I CRISPR-associated protein Cas7 [Clostridium sp.]|uniref:type I CRISPR-associated protein Cas7 n=1 Tax=Clostridium sp. DSM 8431 TaxID=1761781 RepID=UPI0008E3C1F2|nr:type I CRISPR-associated protein Cas7 [Clostridium sp. DSM 8431]MCR4944960.1 type I CRISPR-associated protein Cas7 [Clostridium sp.]SFU78027.1 CRISPR-associated protein Csh2 [Clostridium sp. DSM 8431]